jgi:WD40 repeat protein
MPPYKNPLLDPKLNPRVRTDSHKEVIGWDFSGFMPCWYETYTGTIFSGGKKPLQKEELKEKPYGKEEDLECIIQEKFCFSGHGLDFSPAGNQLAVSKGDYLALCDISYNHHNLQQITGAEHPRDIRGVSFSPNGKFIATTCDDHLMRIFRIDRVGPKKKLKKLNRMWEDKLPGVDLAIAFSPDGRLIARSTIGHNVRICRINYNGITLKPLINYGLPRKLLDMAFTPDNKGIMTVAENNIQLTYKLDLQDQKLIELKKKVLPTKAYGIARNDKNWALATQDGHLIFAEPLMRRQRRNKHPGPVQGVAISRDGKYIATNCKDRFVRIFEVK